MTDTVGRRVKENVSKLNQTLHRMSAMAISEHKENSDRYSNNNNNSAP